MIGYEISLNGSRLCTAASGDTGVLAAAVVWSMRVAEGVREPADLRLEIGGLAAGGLVEWPAPRKLAVGDKVVIKIVETVQADPPPARTRRDDDSALAEVEERKYYERLRQKYEGK